MHTELTAGVEHGACTHLAYKAQLLYILLLLTPGSLHVRPCTVPCLRSHPAEAATLAAVNLLHRSLVHTAVVLAACVKHDDCWQLCFALPCLLMSLARSLTALVKHGPIHAPPCSTASISAHTGIHYVTPAQVGTVNEPPISTTQNIRSSIAGQGWPAHAWLHAAALGHMCCHSSAHTAASPRKPWHTLTRVSR
jgi:hypothetical protein